MDFRSRGTRYSRHYPIIVALTVPLFTDMQCAKIMQNPVTICHSIVQWLTWYGLKFVEKPMFN